MVGTVQIEYYPKSKQKTQKIEKNSKFVFLKKLNFYVFAVLVVSLEMLDQLAESPEVD